MKWVAAAVLALCGVLMAGVPGVRGAQSSVTSFASSDNDKALIDRGSKLMTVDVRAAVRG